jgi:BirA family biotin operon repressor/biotin-[acetyl-CoA-carboxylase] ligase
MHLIKLDQIASTNDYLKQLNKEKNLENFTTIYTENQTHGKGQMGNLWVSEKGKSLTFSTLITISNNIYQNNISLNMMTAVSIIEVLLKNKLENLAIKWPNDIILKNKKIGGILIEQTKNFNHQTSFIIGIGLNMYQKKFINIPNASSIELLTQKKLDLNFLLIEIINQIKTNFNLNTDFKDKYVHYLFKLNEYTEFLIEDKKEIGKIIDISSDGKLMVSLQEKIKNFGIKEIEMLY